MRIGLYLALGLAALVWIGAEARRDVGGAWAASSSYRMAGDAGRHTQELLEAERPPVYRQPDTYYWLMFAQADDFSAWGHRVLPLDNAPEGRSFYWSSLYRGYLRGLHRLFLFTVVDSASAWRYTAMWNGPLLLAGFLLALLVVGARSARLPETLALCGGVLLLPAFRRDFGATIVDYHGLQHVLLLGMLLLLAMSGAGYSEADSGRGSRRERIGLMCSGMLGGLAVALQATLAMPIIAGVLAAGILHALLFIKPGEEQVLQPDQWRVWGLAGGATSLVLYLLEFGLSLPLTRLEVNHPLIALSWCAGAEMVRQVWIAEANGSWTDVRRWGRIAGWSGLAGLYPAAIAWGPAQWFVLKDPFLLRVHETITEFQPLMATFEHTGWLALPLLFGALPLLLLAALAVSFTRHVAPDDKMRLLALALPALIAGRMTFEYVRFTGVWTALLLVLAWAFIRALRPAGSVPFKQRRDGWLAFGLLLSFLPAFVLTSRVDAAGRAEPVPHGEWLARIQMRDLVLEFAERVGPDPVMVLTDANMSPMLQYYTSHQGTGGLYWENREGLWAVAAVLADYGEEEARSVVASRGLHYLLFDASLDQLARIHYARYGWVDEPGLRRMLAYRMAHQADSPRWLIPVDPDAFPLAWAGVYRLYQVDASQLAVQDEGGAVRR